MPTPHLHLRPVLHFAYVDWNTRNSHHTRIFVFLGEFPPEPLYGYARRRSSRLLRVAISIRFPKRCPLPLSSRKKMKKYNAAITNPRLQQSNVTTIAPSRRRTMRSEENQSARSP